MADYILNMGGGTSGGGRSTVVDVFTVRDNGIEMVTGHDLALSIGRDNLVSATVNNYILAMGGGTSGGTSNAVDIFHATESGIEHILDHGLSLSQARRTTAAAAGNYVLAMGGYDGSQFYDTVDVFKVTENGVEAVPDHGLALSVGRVTYGAGCGDYILALGGNPGAPEAYSNAVDVFKVRDNGIEHILDHGLTLSVARRQFATATCGSYILAMGGGLSDGKSNAVDVFKVTDNGVEHITDHGLTLSVPRYNLAAVSCGNYILAMGGRAGSPVSYSTAVDVFKVTESGIEHITDYGLTLSEGRGELAAAACGNYILAMGGYANDAYFNTIDVFQIFS